jgi:hypothetical protein
MRTIPPSAQNVTLRRRRDTPLVPVHGGEEQSVLAEGGAIFSDLDAIPWLDRLAGLQGGDAVADRSSSGIRPLPAWMSRICTYRLVSSGSTTSRLIFGVGEHVPTFPRSSSRPRWSPGTPPRTVLTAEERQTRAANNVLGDGASVRKTDRVRRRGGDRRPRRGSSGLT